MNKAILVHQKLFCRNCDRGWIWSKLDICPFFRKPQKIVQNLSKSFRGLPMTHKIVLHILRQWENQKLFSRNKSHNLCLIAKGIIGIALGQSRFQGQGSPSYFSFPGACCTYSEIFRRWQNLILWNLEVPRSKILSGIQNHFLDFQNFEFGFQCSILLFESSLAKFRRIFLSVWAHKHTHHDTKCS